MENETRWAIKEGIIDFESVPNYLDAAYLDALNEVHPQAVTIIR
jgi:hypothetical protein